MDRWIDPFFLLFLLVQEYKANPVDARGDRDFELFDFSNRATFASWKATTDTEYGGKSTIRLTRGFVSPSLIDGFHLLLLSPSLASPRSCSERIRQTELRRERAARSSKQSKSLFSVEEVLFPLDQPFEMDNEKHTNDASTESSTVLSSPPEMVEQDTELAAHDQEIVNPSNTLIMEGELDLSLAPGTQRLGYASALSEVSLSLLTSLPLLIFATFG